MSKVEAVIMNTKPFRPTDYNEKAIQAVLDESYLTCDVKKDGVRLNLIVDEGHTVDWLSREGKAFPNFAEHGIPLSHDPRWQKFFNPNLGEGMFPEGFMLDAELILLDPLGTEYPCKLTSGALRRKEHALPLSRLRVYVFDIIPLDVILSGEEYKVMQCVRKIHVEYQVAVLKKIFPEIDWKVAESFDVFSIETLPVVEREGFDEEGNPIVVKLQPPLSLNQLYESVRSREIPEEGLVIKDPMGFYRRSKCSGWWKKTPQDNEDGKVVGLVWGSKGKANFGLVIGFEVLLESGHVVNACKISKALMYEFTSRVLAHMGCTIEEFNGRYTSSAECNPYHHHTVRVTCMERYPDGSMRHPSFDEFRGISDPLIKE